MINRKYAASFDKVASTYNIGRVGYADEIYKIIHLYTQLDSRSTILEVGCETGVATREIFNEWHSNIIALEPGASLIDIAASNISDSKIQYINQDFEEFTTSEVIDAIFSATAFHWIAPEVKYKKAFNLLKDNGVLVLYWNNYGIKDDTVYKDIQKIYSEFHPDGTPEQDARLIQREKIEGRKREIVESEYFDLIVHHESVYSMDMTSESYLNLLKSFSNNSSHSQTSMLRFYKAVEKYILDKNDRIILDITVNLEIARKRVVLY